jgi:hypothetical protein
MAVAASSPPIFRQETCSDAPFDCWLKQKTTHWQKDSSRSALDKRGKMFYTLEKERLGERASGGALLKKRRKTFCRMGLCKLHVILSREPRCGKESELSLSAS